MIHHVENAFKKGRALSTNLNDKMGTLSVQTKIVSNKGQTRQTIRVNMASQTVFLDCIIPYYP